MPHAARRPEQAKSATGIKGFFIKFEDRICPPLDKVELTVNSYLMSASSPLERERLASLSKALLSLHKTLLDSEKIGYEESFGKIATPAAFFQLVMGDPWFAWLRTLSEFIVLIDERVGEKEAPVAAGDVQEFVARTREMLTPREDGLGFAHNYHNAMQRDPDVILAHAGIVKFLNSLQDS
jgi:hypothetical protein